MKQKKILIMLSTIFLAIIFVLKSNLLTTKLSIPSTPPIFNQINLEGDTVNLSKYNGKIVVVHFWASWSKSSRIESKNLTRLFNKYKNSNKFEIISISLDTDSIDWKNAITEDGLNWKNHFCDYKKYQSTMVKSFKVSSIPSFFIIDKKGTLINSSAKITDLELEIENNLK